jgi:hypothetical protein
MLSSIAVSKGEGNETAIIAARDGILQGDRVRNLLSFRKCLFKKVGRGAACFLVLRSRSAGGAECRFEIWRFCDAFRPAVSAERAVAASAWGV